MVSCGSSVSQAVMTILDEDNRVANFMARVYDEIHMGVDFTRNLAESVIHYVSSILGMKPSVLRAKSIDAAHTQAGFMVEHLRELDCRPFSLCI